MKAQLFSSSFFAICLLSVVQLNAQTHATERTISQQDLLVMQQGEVDAFQNLLFRFETALDENDEESATVLHQVLCEAMKNEINQAAESATDDDNLLPCHARQLLLYKELVAWSYVSGNDHADVKNRFGQFAEEMQFEVDFMKK